MLIPLPGGGMGMEGRVCAGVKPMGKDWREQGRTCRIKKNVQRNGRWADD